jgi:hypothetical protein
MESLLTIIVLLGMGVCIGIIVIGAVLYISWDKD